MLLELYLKAIVNLAKPIGYTQAYLKTLTVLLVFSPQLIFLSPVLSLIQPCLSAGTMPPLVFFVFFANSRFDTGYYSTCLSRTLPIALLQLISWTVGAVGKMFVFKRQFTDSSGCLYLLICTAKLFCTKPSRMHFKEK